MSIIRNIVIVLIGVLFVGCDKIFDETNDNAEYNFSEFDLNRIDPTCLNGWDDGFLIGDYYSVFSTEDTKDLLIYANAKDFEESDGIFIVCDSTQTIRSLGTSRVLYTVENINNQVRLWRITEDGYIEEYFISYNNAQTRAIDFLSLKNIESVFDAISNAVSGGIGLNQLIQGDWNGLFDTLKGAGVDFTVGQLLKNVPIVNIGYIYGKGSFEYYNWNEARRQCSALYADCNTSIVEVQNDSEGDCLVYVDVTNIKTIAPYLFNFYNKEEIESNKNIVYCGVVARRIFTPTYHNYSYISSLTCLNENETSYGNNANLMLALPALTHHIYELRPFLISSRVVDDNSDIREEYIKYGESFTFYPSGEYETLKQLYEDTNGDNWTNNDNWLSDKPLNEWYGLTLTEDGYVKSIDLADNNLTGEFNLNALKKLQSINISNNALEAINITTHTINSIELINCIVDYGSTSIYGPKLVTIKDNSEIGSLNIECETLIVDNCNFGETYTPFSSVNATSVLITNSTMYNCGLNNDYLTFENSKTTNTWYCNTNIQAKLINSYCSVICSWDFSESATIIVSNTTLFQPEWNEKKTGKYSFTTNSNGWAKMFE